MLYIITPCSRPENLIAIQPSIPNEAKWIICHDGKNGNIPSSIRASIMLCEDNGFVGAKAQNHILDNYTFNNNDCILFHDDDNIIHNELYSSISPFLNNDFSLMCWGQLNKDNSIRLKPSNKPAIYQIDTASYLVKWKYNKHIRHDTAIYEHDGKYAEDCAKNGPVLTINDFLAYYNYLR
jgi:hypothetical protein